jgi:hypothetical protein
MPDREEVNPVLVHVERVNDSVVAHARPENDSILSTNDVDMI